MGDTTTVMPKVAEVIYSGRSQYLAYIGLSIGALGLTGMLFYSDRLLFRRFIGGINPLITFLSVSILGAILLTFLLQRERLAIYKGENLAGLLRYSGLAALFVIASILVDLKVGFRADLNVSFPKSLAFYPAIGFLVEILFHVLPLTILLAALTTIFKNTSYSHIVWICILIVALLEPTYQSAPMVSSNYFPLWAVAIIWLNIFVFNLCQLVIFKRYDFISMYSFRLVYYLAWHIMWGYIRLKLLF